jgi:pilus assembly protein CpaE
MTNMSGVFSATIITVCVEPETADQILRVVNQMPWLITSSSFEAYVSANRRPYFGAQVKASNACIAVVDFDQDPDQAVESVRYLHQVFPGKVTVIALATSREPELLLQSMRAGCTEFLPKPFTSDEVSALLDRLQQSWSNTSTARNTPVGSVISFFGAKGGVGTTTLAVHLAMYLVHSHEKRVLLIDNRPELGHVCVYLGMDGSRCQFHEVVRNVNRLDSDLLQASIGKHPSGLHVLASPDTCGGTKYMESDAVAKTLEFLRTEYDYVIVDCPTSLNDVNLAVIDSSAMVYLVATPEIGAIRDLSRYVDNLMQIEFTTEKMHVVINRFSSRFAVAVEQIEKAIRLPVALKLPSSYLDLVRAVNLGEPISAKSKSEFAIQVSKWTSTLVGSSVAPAPAKKEKSFLQMFK